MIPVSCEDAKPVRGSMTDKSFGKPPYSANTPTFAVSGGEVAATPCWTCKRRRLKCDNHLPSCRKCKNAGRKCLGYDARPLVWNKGVASRGKMMGKTFEAEARRRINSGQTGMSVSGSDNGISTEDGSNESIETILRPNLESSSLQLASRTNAVASGSHSKTIMGSSRNEIMDIRNELSSPNSKGPTASVFQKALYRSLTDPVFQDLTSNDRYYMYYFDQRLCRDTVLYDLPGHNPFRELIPITATDNLLLKVVLATSACHYSIAVLSNQSLPTWPATTSVSTMSSKPRGHVMTITSSEAYTHSLVYKLSALRQLREALQDPQRQNEDSTIASVLLFVWLDVLESGKDTWRLHMEGLKKLVRDRLENQRGNSNDVGDSTTGSSSLESCLSLHFVDASLVFDIMGATLAGPYASSSPLVPSPAVFQLLKRSESLLFLGCPAELLYLISLVNWQAWSMSSDGPKDMIALSSPLSSSQYFFQPILLEDTPSERASTVLQQIQEFDATIWAQATQRWTPQSDLSDRTAIAQAYKSTAQIYAIRILSVSSSVDILSRNFVDQLLANLSSISPDSPFFKTLIWPTFIAGTECKTPEQRNCIRGLLGGLWVALSSYNIRSAGLVLEDMWGKADRGRGLPGGMSWIDELAKAGVDWMFV